MDKKTELIMQQRRIAPQPEASMTATAVAEPPEEAQVRSGWWMYHGDPEHTGYVSDSQLNTANVGSPSFTTLHTLELGGPVLSVPAVVDGFIYVGLANDQHAEGGNGGALHKIDIASGQTVQTFRWDLGTDSPDAHHFTGMGCTPMVVNGNVYFGAFNGKFYCLDQETLKPVWITDLRNEDLDHNQPITNIAGVGAGYPAAVMWSSPVVSADGTKLYVGCGEGENPEIYSFVFCLDTATGNVKWIYCTNLFCTESANPVNMLPQQAVQQLPPPATYKVFDGEPIVMGCSVWGSIAYDKDVNRIYCPTGNQQPEPSGYWADGPFKPELPSPGFSNGVLALDADTGEFKGFYQVPPESHYRPSDFDIDLGSAPVILNWQGRKVVIQTCKNGTVFVLDAKTLAHIKSRQLLPKMNDGSLIATVDRHPADPNAFTPDVTNEESNKTPGENYSGPFNTAAFYPGSAGISARLFIGMGGPNYHSASPGIDYETTPFMRAVDLDSPTLDDAWPMDNSDPKKYTKPWKKDPNFDTDVGMYASAGECGLSSPAVVNDVVFCSTSKISIYAFDVRDGTFLWSDDLGMQTDGDNGGYGYCLGPAIWNNYVVAGALVFGRDGGVLKIYGLSQ